MMGSFSEDDEECPFFDAPEGNVSSPELGFECSELEGCSSQYDVWIRGPLSVQERRDEFLRSMGLSLEDKVTSVNLRGGRDNGVFEGERDRVMESSGAVLRNSVFEDEFSSSRSTLSSWSDNSSDSRGLGSRETFVCRTSNADASTEADEDEQEQHITLSKMILGDDQMIIADDVDNSHSSPLAEQLENKEIKAHGNMARAVNRLKARWLSRLRSFSCVLDQGKADGLRSSGTDPILRGRVQRVKVRHSKKRLKEFSALFVGQDIQAHDGSILTMKFSSDGQFLASAGEDEIVRVWQIVEDERVNEVDIPDTDPSCVYFTVNHLSELSPLAPGQEKFIRLKRLRKTADSACVIFPPVVFRILEKPLHEFHGHSGEILDLSWSKNNVS